MKKLINKIFTDNIMPYIPRIASRVNKADSCGGGMKKAGLVYGSDWPKITSRILSIKTPGNIVFGLKGVSCGCGQRATTNLNGAQSAMRNSRTAFNH